MNSLIVVVLLATAGYSFGDYSRWSRGGFMTPWRNGRTCRWEFVGCFKDTNGQLFEKDASSKISKGEMTWMTCSKECSALGAAFSGVHNQNKCICGDDPIGNLVESQDCDLECPGDNKLNCGGAQATWVNACYLVN